LEYGWINPGIQLDTVKILLASDGVTYTILIDDFAFTYTATVPTDDVTVIRDALVTAVNKYRRIGITNISGTFVVGDTITGTGGGTAEILFIGQSFFLIRELTGTLLITDTLTGTTTGPPTADATTAPISLVTGAALGADELTLTSDLAGDPFSLEITTNGVDPTLEVDVSDRKNTSWLHLF
jgi:hypothetical protein